MQMQWIIHDDEDKILKTNKKKYKNDLIKKVVQYYFNNLKPQKI